MTESSLLSRPRFTWRSDAIDVLRAGLALWVIVVHLAEWGPLSSTGRPDFVGSIDRWTISTFQSHGETHPAVLIFIVLSGYCIHRNGCRRDDRSWSEFGYAAKRFFRIVPVFVLATIVGAAVVLALRSHEVVPTITATSHVSVGCTAAKLTGAAAFDPGLLRCSYVGNAPLNTVMVEIWLYVVYGLAAWLLLRGVRDRTLLAAIAIAGFAGAAFVAGHLSDAGWWHNSSLIGYLPYWWIGAIAVGARRAPIVGAFAASVIAWIALTVCLDHTRLGGAATFSIAELRKVAFAVAVAATIWWLDSRARTLPRPVTNLGRAGYSLYAFHAPIIVACVALGAPWWVPIVVAITVALTTYRLVEVPMIARGRAIARRRHGDVAVPLEPASDTAAVSS